MRHESRLDGLRQADFHCSGFSGSTFLQQGSPPSPPWRLPLKPFCLVASHCARMRLHFPLECPAFEADVFLVGFFCIICPATATALGSRSPPVVEPAALSGVKAAGLFFPLWRRHLLEGNGARGRGTAGAKRAWRGGCGGHVFGSLRDRAVFSGEDNATLCGGSAQQNGRRKGPLGKESADEPAKILLRHNVCCLSPFRAQVTRQPRTQEKRYGSRPAVPRR